MGTFDGAEAPAASAKSSTQRVREFRQRQREKGSKPSGVILSQQTQIAIDLIKQVRRMPYKVKIIEAALIREAKRLCPCPERSQELVDKGLLSAETAMAWRQALEAEEALAGNAPHVGNANPPIELVTPQAARRHPGDVRGEVGPHNRDLRLKA